jgi:heme-degrading monooxygenase HmoA
MSSGFERVWRFRVGAGLEPEFERVYGSTGAWAQLFSRARGYRGTELHRLEKHSPEYLLVDRWESRAAWEAFRRDHAAAYERLDRECEALTLTEELVREADAPLPDEA